MRAVATSGRLRFTCRPGGAAGQLDVEVERREAYPIVMAGPGPDDGLGACLRRVPAVADASKVVIVADATVARLHVGAVVAALESAGKSCVLVVLRSGERTKAPATLLRLWQRLEVAGADRRTPLVVVSGGVICDVAGLAAATYLRGIPLVLVPTTLMAQIDAAIGGKTGADFRGVKNRVGAFHHPVAVIIDVGFLRTLGDVALRNGAAELVKVALLTGGWLWQAVQRAAGSGHGAGQALAAIVEPAVAAKLELLGPDPYEQDNLDRALNFGHCVGHALEAASGWQMLHGFCVAIGMDVALRVAAERGLTSPHLCGEVRSVLDRFSLPVQLPPSLLAATWANLEDVRRVRGGALRFTALREPGAPLFLGELEHDELVRAAGFRGEPGR